MYMGYASHVGSGNDVDMSAVELMSSISVAVPGSISSDVKDVARSVHDKISKCILNQ